MSDNDKAQLAAMGEHITDFLSRADRAMEIYERMSPPQMAAELADTCAQRDQMAEALRDVLRWIAHGNVSERGILIARIDALLAGGK